jgi:alanine-glyoxylate transaminase / serine-glyoxylate transaminase / serine-pyruvate transaminase
MGERRPRLMIVGPGEMHDSDLEVMGEQLVAHFGDSWQAEHEATVAAVGRLLGCEHPPYLIPGSGTATLDAALLNLFEPGQTIVIPDTGFFGNRLLEIAQAQRLEAIRLEVGIGEPVDPTAVSEAVTRHGAVGVAVCHVDTSVATRNPIREIAEAARAAGALTVVDGIASVGGERCDVDAFGLGALVTATQKGLEAPPGLGILALGPEGVERAASRSERPAAFYLDLAVWDRYRSEWPHHPHPVTMPASIVKATRSSVERILSHGLGQTIEAKHLLAAKVRAGLEEMGLKPVARSDAQAGMIVAAYADDPASIVGGVLERGIMIAGGLAPLAGKAIRIGVMGKTATEEMIDATLSAISETLA